MSIVLTGILAVIMLSLSAGHSMAQSSSYMGFPDDPDYDGIQIVYIDPGVDAGEPYDFYMGSGDAVFITREYTGEVSSRDYIHVKGGFQFLGDTLGIKYYVGTIGIYEPYGSQVLTEYYSYPFDATSYDPYPTFDKYMYCPGREEFDLKMELIGTDDTGKTWDIRVIYHLYNNFYQPSSTPVAEATPTPYPEYQASNRPTPTTTSGGDSNPILDPIVRHYLEEAGMGDLPLIGAALIVCLYAYARKRS